MTGRIRRRRKESAITLIQKHRRSAILPVGCGQIDLAVAVQISGGDAEGNVADLIGGWRAKGCVSLAEENTDCVTWVFLVSGIGDRKIEVAVAVEISHHNLVRNKSRIVDRRSEGTIAIAQQDLDLGNKIPEGNDVKLPIMVEVAHRDVTY